MLQSLLLFAVILCGSHIAEPVQAHAAELHGPALESGHWTASDDEDGGQQRTDDAAHANAHHCPLAAAVPSQDADRISVLGMAPVGSAVQALASRALAPPEEPPLR